MAKDLKIRIISHTIEPIFLALYQQDITLNITNFKITAWIKGMIPQGGSVYTVFPQKLQALGRVNFDNTIFNTKTIDIDYSNSYEIFGNDSRFDIKQSNAPMPGEKTIDIYNKTPSKKEVVILRGGKPLFYGNLRPDSRLNFLVNPSINIAICDFEMNNEIFEIASFSQTYCINYGIQEYLTIILNENVSTGKIFVDTDFNKFSIPNN